MQESQLHIVFAHVSLHFSNLTTLSGAWFNYFKCISDMKRCFQPCSVAERGLYKDAEVSVTHIRNQTKRITTKVFSERNDMK